MPPARSSQQYLLYAHVPFCVALCPFCSFHRVRFREDRARRYFGALRREVRLATDAGYRFREMYIGGGTPTVLPQDLCALINDVRDAHAIEQVSVETNPDDLRDEVLQRLADVGVTRLSVGVQSFDDGLLTQMQRIEKYGSGDEIISRLESARGRIPTLNVDMMFNFPEQTDRSLQRDLNTLTSDLGVDQVSFYPLMADANTQRAMARSIGQRRLGRERSLYEQIAAHMLDAGYSRSSAWCFSREPGMSDEYIVDNDEYLGLGSGAFSYIDGCLMSTTFSINHYLQLLASGHTGVVRHRQLSEREQMRYFLLSRLFAGRLSLQAAKIRFRGRFASRMLPEISILRMLGAVRRDPDALMLTEYGQYLWVKIMREFFTGVNNYREDMRRRIASESALLAMH